MKNYLYSYACEQKKQEPTSRRNTSSGNMPTGEKLPNRREKPFYKGKTIGGHIITPLKSGNNFNKPNDKTKKKNYNKNT